MPVEGKGNIEQVVKEGSYTILAATMWPVTEMRTVNVKTISLFYYEYVFFPLIPLLCNVRCPDFTSQYLSIVNFIS